MRRADLLVDVGSSINPALDIGQVEGGFTQGMGWTTTEEVVIGDTSAARAWVKPAGRLLNSGPGGYKLPSFNDTPAALNVRLMSGAVGGDVNELITMADEATMRATKAIQEERLAVAKRVSDMQAKIVETLSLIHI